MIEQNLHAVDARTRSQIQRLLMADEEFIFSVVTSDRIISRWCTRLIATSKRLLTIRHFLFDTTIRGILMRKVNTIRSHDTKHILIITGDVKTWELEFESAGEVNELKDKLEQLQSQLS